MVRLLMFLVVLGFVGGAMMGCDAEGTVDNPHNSSVMISPR